MNKHLLLILLIIISFSYTEAQRKWVGGQGTAWDNPQNWEPAGLPVVTDEVVLDNSEAQNDYMVTLPLTPVTVTSISITPATAKVIRLVLPATNLASPALTLTSTEDALLLNRGAVFQNASGLSSGQSLRIAGKIRLNNGGTYIHNTRSAHANDVVAKLSAEEGTEEGLFEFDIPGASSTISLSNRVFGKLKLSSVSYNAPVAYSGGGSNPVIIRSDLEIGERVSFSIGFSNIFSIKRNLIQSGGIFNISNDNNPSVVSIGGNILQSGGVITETGTALPVIWLNGGSRQQLWFSGGITNQVIFRSDNIAGVELKTHLTLPFRLELNKGIITSHTHALLTLSPGCELKADSISGSFVDGPLKRMGLNGQGHVLFPVGYLTKQRWAALKNATGSFTVTYKQENPYTYSGIFEEGIDHTSSLETWTIVSEQTNASAQVELSFDNMHSGGVTDLQTLRVAQLQSNSTWANLGNTGTTGSAGAAGSVISEAINAFYTDSKWFTLASSVSNKNILPQNEIHFSARKEGGAIRFEWQTISDLPVIGFEIESASDNHWFQAVKTVVAPAFENRFTLLYYPRINEKYFRVKAMVSNGAGFLSKVIYVKRPGHEDLAQTVIVRHNQLVIPWHTDKSEELRIYIYDNVGRLLVHKKEKVVKGAYPLILPDIALATGVYFITIVSKEGRRIMKFFNP